MVLVDNEGKIILEPGLFEVFVRGSQPDERSESLTATKVQRAQFEVVGNAMELERY